MHSPRVLALCFLHCVILCAFCHAESESNPREDLPAIKGLKVLLTGTKLTPIKVWLQNSDLFVYVRDEDAIRQYYDENRKLEAAEGDYHEKRRREDNARYRACFSWRLFKEGNLGDPVSKPSEFREFDSEAYDLVKPFAQMDDKSLSRARIGDTIILVPSAYNGGLWKMRPGRQPEPLLDGYFENPVAEDSGRWLLIEHRNQESVADSVILIDMKSLRQHTIAPGATRCSPVMYLPLSRRFLLCRTEIPAMSNGNKEPDCQYLLLDPETRAMKPARGEFRPLLQTGTRLLQPTDNRDWYWAAIPDQARDQTQVGRYNQKTFTFESLLVFPHLLFDSMDMMVDLKGASIYVVHQEKLLRLPFLPTK